MVPSMSHKWRDPRCRVFQYVHDSLMVGGVTDGSTYPSKWVVAYGSKEDLILNAMVVLRP